MAIVKHRGVNAVGTVPLIIAFSGSGGSGSGIETQMKWSTWCDNNGNWAVVLPDAPYNPLSLGWDGGNGNWAGTLAWLKTQIAGWCSTLNADPNRLYVCGFSEGGDFTVYILVEGSLNIKGCGWNGGWWLKSPNPFPFDVQTYARDDAVGVCQIAHQNDAIRPDGTNSSGTVNAHPYTDHIYAAAAAYGDASNSFTQSSPPVDAVGPVDNSVFEQKYPSGLVRYWQIQSGTTGTDHQWSMGEHGVNSTNEIGAFFKYVEAHTAGGGGVKPLTPSVINAKGTVSGSVSKVSGPTKTISGAQVTAGSTMGGTVSRIPGGGGGTYNVVIKALYEGAGLDAGISQEGHQNGNKSSGIADNPGVTIMGDWYQGTNGIVAIRGTRTIKTVLMDPTDTTMFPPSAGYTGGEKTRAEGKVTTAYAPARGRRTYHSSHLLPVGWDPGTVAANSNQGARVTIMQLHWNGTQSSGMISPQLHNDHVTLVLATGVYNGGGASIYGTHSDWDMSVGVGGAWSVAGMLLVPVGALQRGKWLDLKIEVNWQTDGTGWVDGWYRYPEDDLTWIKTINGSGGGVVGMPCQTMLTSNGNMPSTVYEKWGPYRFNDSNSVRTQYHDAYAEALTVADIDLFSDQTLNPGVGGGGGGGGSPVYSTIPLASLVTGWNVIDLSDITGVLDDQETGLRLSISGAAPTGTNLVVADSSAGPNAPTLDVTYSGGATKAIAPSLISAKATMGGSVTKKAAKALTASPIAALSFLAGSVAARHKVGGAITATSSVSGLVSFRVLVVPATVNAVSTLSGRISVKHFILGVNISATATVSARIRRFWRGIAILSPATVSGTVHRIAGVRPSVIGATSTAHGSLVRIAGPRYIAGNIVATSTVVGRVGRRRPITTSAIISVVTVRGRVQRRLRGQIFATSTVSGQLVRIRTGFGQINAQSSVVGHYGQLKRPFTGAITATSTVSGRLGTVRQISGIIPASTFVTGTVGRKRRVVGGHITSTTTVSGFVVRIARGISGFVAASSTVSGARVTLLHSLAPSRVRATSTVTGSISRDYVAKIYATSTIHGMLALLLRFPMYLWTPNGYVTGYKFIDNGTEWVGGNPYIGARR